MDLTIRSSPSGVTGRQVLNVGGALDVQSRAMLTDAGRAHLSSHGATGLVLDLSAVTFIDSVGLGALIELGGAAHDVERDFLLRAPSVRVWRVLTLTGMADLWPVEPAEHD